MFARSVKYSLITAALLFLSLRATALSDTPDLVLLHINDTHGHLVGLSEQEAPKAPQLDAQVKSLRALYPEKTLLLHAGDVLSRGGPITVHHGGIPNFALLNQLGVDAFTPGNGDFYLGLEILLDREKQAKFPFVHANLYQRETGKPLFAPYCIINRNDLRIAILGLGTIRTNHPSATTLSLKSVISSAKKFLPEIRPKADLIIALTHIGHDGDQRLAQRLAGIDLIVGGHSHTQLFEALRVQTEDQDWETVVVQAGSIGAYLGQLKIYLQKSETGYHIAREEGSLIPLDAPVNAAHPFQSFLEPYALPVKEKIATLKKPLRHEEGGLSEMGCAAAAALREATQCQAALLDFGAVRQGLNAGEVRLADLYRVHPWRNKVVTTTMSGAQLKLAAQLKGYYLAFQGYESLPELLEIQGKAPSEIQDDVQYSLALGDYGATENPLLRRFPRTPSPFRVDTALRAWLQQHHPIAEQSP